MSLFIRPQLLIHVQKLEASCREQVWWLTGLVLFLNAICKVSCNLTCLSCLGVTYSSDCEYVETCGDHSICFIDMYIGAAGNIYFNLGCRDTRKCPNYSHGRRDLSTNTTHFFYQPSSRQHFDTLQSYLTNMSITGAEIGVAPHKLGELEQKTVHSVQRRDDKLACGHCCDSGNLCNVEGCGQKGYIQPRGPICFGCDQQLKPDSCREINVCGRDDICYIEEIQIFQDTLYRTMCLSKSKCQDHNIVIVKAAGMPIGRDVSHISDITDDVININEEKRSSSPARGCCHGDMCNSMIPQNGNWGPWTTWGSCSASCGYNGTRQRTRRCEFPPPNYGGLPCVGKAFEVDSTCANSACNQGLVCLSCTSSISPRTCNYVETCGPNSVCYLEQYVTHVGEIRFVSGCRDRLKCTTGVRKTKRMLTNGDYMICTECCYGDLCNNHGCGETRHPYSGPVCYNCSQQTDPEHCGQIDICKYGQACGLTRRQFGATYYQTKCLDKQSCASSDPNSNVYPKCCTTSLCTFPKPSSVGFTPAPTKTSGHVGFTLAPTKTTGSFVLTTVSPTKTSGPPPFTPAPTKTSGPPPFTPAPTKTSGPPPFTPAPTKTSGSVGFTTAPPINTATYLVTKTAPPTKPTVNPAGHWTEWDPWGPCSEPNPGKVGGYRERVRYCVNHNNDPTCIDGDKKIEQQHCNGGGPNHCSPVKINNVTVTMGKWEIGGNVQLTCFVTGYPKPEVKWSTHTLSNDTSVSVSPFDEWSIVISNIEDKHRGLYQCKASNKCSTAQLLEYTAPNFTKR